MKAHKLSSVYRFKLARHQKVREKSQEQFDASSIGDLSFLLLIFFIVTSSFLLKQGLFISLPSPQSVSQSIDANRVLSVAPQTEGYLVNGVLKTETELRKVIQTKSSEVEDPVILVSMKAGVPYNKLVQALSISREEKVTKVSLKFEQ